MVSHSVAYLSIISPLKNGRFIWDRRSTTMSNQTCVSFLLNLWRPCRFHLNRNTLVSKVLAFMLCCGLTHYNGVIMRAIASQIASLTIVYSTVYSRRRSKKTPKLCVTGLCVVNSPVTGEFTAQRASNAENVSIWWRHHGISYRDVISWHWQSLHCKA